MATVRTEGKTAPATRSGDGVDANPADHDAFGTPDHLRRLSDKILAAFNHAYATGETEVAARLRSALIEAERQARRDRPERRAGTALKEASLWVSYVQARNRYIALAEDGSATPTGKALALAAMQRAYQRWSEI